MRAPRLMKHRAVLIGALFSLASVVCADDGQRCPAAATWVSPSPGLAQLDHHQLILSASSRQVVLLGEEHDNAGHHTWQLHTLAALHSRRPNMRIGFEGFPRAVQPALDQWVQGRMSETQFLRDVQWDRNWGYEAKHYLPIFHFARMHRVPLLALNVDRTLVRKVGRSGWGSIPQAEREGVGDPAPASAAYRESLLAAYRAHGRGAPAGSSASQDDSGFSRFVESMQLWDRAMAEAIANALRTDPSVLVVALTGRGHLEHRHGIPRQLDALGISDVSVLLPWDIHSRCAPPPAGIADAVFGIEAFSADVDGPRLGVELAPGSDDSSQGVRIQHVLANSIAEASGLRAGDIILNVAGETVTAIQSVIAAVRRQAPGTWLPITVLREGTAVDLVAKFPPAT